LPSVIHHQRLPDQCQVSIERLFDGIRQAFSPEWQLQSIVSPRPSVGLLPRLNNLRTASRLKADIHHIVGDVHYLAFGLPGNQLVLTIHDCAVLARLKGCRRELMRQLWFVQPMRRAAVVTTISETTKQELRRWVGKLADKVTVIPNCVRADFQAESKPFNTGCPVVLQVGTGWNKNVVGVARGLIGTPCRLEIVGQLDSLQRADIDATGVSYRELGRISDEDLLEAYHRCDLVVFASFYEGFGLPIIEAQAIGRPVVTSNLSSMPEVAGEGALFVDPGSTSSIRGAVTSLLHDEGLRSSLVEKGFKNVERFRPNVIAGMYAAVYERLLQASDSHARHSH
jgi:glycosyltransferase involved in cell wall biosynthesis